MDQRIVEFIAALRAAGVRVSIAESQDAFEAAQYMGINIRQDFHDSLRTTLVKEHQDHPIFDQLFPLYFGNDEPPLMNLDEELSPEERQLLQQALRALLEQLRQQSQEGQQSQQGQPSRQRRGQPTSEQINNLMQLLQALLQGQNLNQEMLDQAGQRAGCPMPPIPMSNAGLSSACGASWECSCLSS